MPRSRGRTCRKGRKTIKRRILTGVILLPLLILFILFASAEFFSLLVCLVALLALIEFCGMALPGERVNDRLLIVAGGTLLTICLVFTGPVARMSAVTFSLLLFAIFFLLRYHDLKTVAHRLALAVFGFLYLPLLLSHLALLRDLPFGRQWIFTVLLLVMMGDTAAYFVGINLGRHKLYPAVSPNKSVEGAVGGLAGSLAGIFLAKLWFFPALQVGDCLLLGVVVGSLAQLGDLFESMLKRSFGVKDSGTMIPGHGGILDRLDSLLFAFPPIYYYALWSFGTQGMSK